MYLFFVCVLPFRRRSSLINDDATTTLLENGDFEEARPIVGVGRRESTELIVLFIFYYVL